VQTLATQFWSYQQNLAYGQAAPFALLMIAIAAVPSYVLGRFFDPRARSGCEQSRGDTRRCPAPGTAWWPSVRDTGQFRKHWAAKVP
jgi:hypothetical protein